ncbi:MAG: substrate-binding domain-containing protein [Sphingopyxis solisilvae]|uniref:substrate-binding domain-containing protein n=1 Tax=Sphingopyxis solisilvae TaxID=1886788 RepID=UPI0040362C5C
MAQKFAPRTLGVVGAAVCALALSACQDQASSGGSARDFISAAGSSTVYPFATTVGERFAEATGNKTPKIDSTGTGGGFERFCQGIGAGTPDISNASRRMKKSEFDKCQANGVKDIIEIQIGYDGLAFGEAQRGPGLALTLEDIYKGLAANPYGKPNTAKTWKDVNPALPAVGISVFGPPSTSGTYDSFKELLLMAGCDKNPEMKALKASDEDKHKAVCGTFRGSPYYVEQGENDNLIISKLNTNPTSIGAFGFSYLNSNRDKVKGIAIDGVQPTMETITNGTYPGSRAMYIYIKKAHVGTIPGLMEYAAEFAKGAAAGGYLNEKGLIPPHKDMEAKIAATIQSQTVMDGSELK